MKTLLVIVFVLTLTTLTFGQEKLAVRWDLTNNPNCRRVLIDGVEYRLIKNGDVIVGTTFEFISGYIAVNIYVANGSDKSFDVLPDRIRLESYKTLADAIADKADISEIVPVSRIRKSIMAEGRWQALFGLMAAGAATNTYSIWNYDTGYTTLTVPNYAAQAEARAAVAEQKARNRAAADSVEAIMLKANTVFPGKALLGYVFFKAKRRSYEVVRVPVNGEQYLFLYNFAP